MEKHETYKRNNKTDMQKHNKNKQERHSPHNGYKYKSLFIIIIKICLACIGFYNKMILKLEKLNYFKKFYFFIKFQRKFANFEAKKKRKLKWYHSNMIKVHYKRRYFHEIFFSWSNLFWSNENCAQHCFKNEWTLGLCSKRFILNYQTNLWTENEYLLLCAFFPNQTFTQ